MEIHHSAPCGALRNCRGAAAVLPGSLRADLFRAVLGWQLRVGAAVALPGSIRDAVAFRHGAGGAVYALGAASATVSPGVRSDASPRFSRIAYGAGNAADLPVFGSGRSHPLPGGAGRFDGDGVIALSGVGGPGGAFPARAVVRRGVDRCDPCRFFFRAGAGAVFRSVGGGSDLDVAFPAAVQRELLLA